jgi:hypothetical protein
MRFLTQVHKNVPTFAKVRELEISSNGLYLQDPLHTFLLLICKRYQLQQKEMNISYTVLLQRMLTFQILNTILLLYNHYPTH